MHFQFLMLRIHYLSSLWGKHRGIKDPKNIPSVKHSWSNSQTSLWGRRYQLLSIGLAGLSAECSRFHLVMNCKRRVQDTEWYLSCFWDLTTKHHSWAQKIWHWKDTLPLLFHLFSTSTIFYFPLCIILWCEERGRRERVKLQKGKVVLRNTQIVLTMCHTLF